MPLARHDDETLRETGHGGVFLLTCLLRGMTMCLNVRTENRRFLLTCLLRGMTGDEVNANNEEISFYSHASCEA